MNSPRLAVINGTCLEVIDQFLDWVRDQGIEPLADPTLRNASPEQLAGILEGVEAVVGPTYFPFPEDLFSSLSSLKVYSLASSGFDTLNVSLATQNGVVITHAPGRMGAEVVADHTWGLMLALTRQIPYHHQLLQAGRYERGMGTCIHGKTLGILGLGRIGRCVARRASGFNVKVLACEISPDMDFIREHQIQLVSLDDLLRQSDILSLHLRLEPDTKFIIGERELGLMKRTAILVNAARSLLVDEEALTRALLNQTIAGAAIDDPPQQEYSPLLKLSNYICTPHVGNRAIEGVLSVTRRALENAVDVLHGRRPSDVVNPEVYAGQLRAPLPFEVPV